MAGLNLHDIVRPIITYVNPDETALLYQSNGQMNTLGKTVPIYNSPVEVVIQFQPLDTEALRQLERLSDTKASEQVFMYSDEALPVAGIKRLPSMRTGDFIYHDNQWWLVTSVMKDWNKRGWCNCGISLQITPPDFSACEWFPKPLEVK